MAFMDTPRTDVGANLTFLDTAANAIDDMSIEASFQEPKKPEHNLVGQMRSKRSGGGAGPPAAASHSAAGALRTPSARAALAELSSRKLNPGRRAGEFTPLLQSATKRNALKAAAHHGGGAQETPAAGAAKGGYYGPGDAMPQFLRDDLERNMTPLARPEFSFMSHASGATPKDESILRPPDSSGYSTPMHFPGRGEGVLGDGRNMMNLKEQERVVDKIEKENFGLKLKIHFLEQKIAERDPNFNENALKENNQLKMDRVIMQKELHKIKKQLAKAEKEAEALRLELRDAQASAEREEELQRLDDECNELQARLDQKEAEIRRRDAELERLSDQVEDLQAGDKDAELERKDEELDRLKEQLEEARAAGDRTDEIERRDAELDRLRNELEDAQASEANNADLARKDAEIERLQEQLEDLQASDERDVELARKEAEIERLQEQLEDLQASDERDAELARKEAEIERLQEQVEDLQTSDERDVELSRKETELDRLREQIDQLQAASDSKDRSAEIAKLRRAHDRNEADAADREYELDQLRQQLKDMEVLAASRDDSAELQRLQAASRQKDAELNDKDAEIDRLGDQVAALRAAAASTSDEGVQLQKLQTAYYEKQAASDRKDLELRRVKQQLEDSQATTRAKNYSPRINRLQADYDRKEADLQRRDGEIDRLHQELKSKSTSASTEARELAALREACETKSSEIARLTETCSKKERQMADVLAEYDSFAKDKEREMEKLRDHGTAFADYQSSKANDMTTQVASLEMALDSKDRDLQAALQELQGRQKEWERERARVRFVNTSMTSDERSEKAEQLERRHADAQQQLKLRYRDHTDLLAREIRWLRAKAEREAGFKAALVHEKTYLAAKAAQYEAFNVIDLNLLADMNCRAEGKVAPGRSPASRFATAALAVRFTVRMRRMADAWAEQRKLRPLRTSSSTTMTKTSAPARPTGLSKPSATAPSRRKFTANTRRSITPSHHLPDPLPGGR